LQSIALAAPTGKAADRMRQAVAGHLAAVEAAAEADQRLVDNCPPATTLHRLLGYSPGKDRFWHNQFNPLSEKLVIVDESSMIDLIMIDHLLRALQPEAKLVLLGDADQLPSIEAGAVLRDLCHSRKAVEEKKRVVVLEKSYRAREEDSAGKGILDAAVAIKEGCPPAEASGGSVLTARKEVSELAFTGVESLRADDEHRLDAFLNRWHELLISGLPDLNERLQYNYRSGPAGFDQDNTAGLKEIFGHFERLRILCATKRSAGGTGSEEVNAWFYHRWLEHLRQEGLVTTRPHFLVGEPVMITRNDYTLRLYNGDSGLVLYVAMESAARQRPAEPMAVFPRSGSFVAYPLEALRGRLEPAWATTVHKAQGSEYEKVAIILPRVYVRTLTRELLYTAVTRAKKSVVIVGSEEIMNLGISYSLKRASGLADMLC
ncbi:MAG: ATP-dependent DNA helicase, partial [Bacillota bacterium]